MDTNRTHNTVDQAYNIGCSFLSLLWQSVADSIKFGLKAKGATTIFTATGIIDVQLHSVVTTDPIKLSRDWALTSKDSRLFLFNFCYNFLYNLAISKKTSDKIVKAKDDISSVLGRDCIAGPINYVKWSLFDSPQNQLSPYMSWMFNGFRSYIGSLASKSIYAKVAVQGCNAVIGVLAQNVLLHFCIDFGAAWSFQYIGVAVVALKFTSFVGEIIQKGLDKVMLKDVQYYIEGEIAKIRDEERILGLGQAESDEQFIVRKIKELGSELNPLQIEEITKEIIEHPFIVPTERNEERVEHNYST